MAGKMAKRRVGKDLSKNLHENQSRLDEAFGESPDIVQRFLRLGHRGRIGVLIVAVEGLYNSAFISEQVVAPIRRCGSEVTLTRTNAFKHVDEALITASQVEVRDTLSQVVEDVLAGNTAVLVDGSDHALVVKSAAPPIRSIEEPESETLVRGPREGFNESLETTVALIRRRVRSAALRFEQLQIGTESRTPVDIVYIQGLVDQDVLDKVRERLKRIDIDSVLDTAYLEEYISNQPYALYPTVLATERPDKVAAALLEGRVAIAADGTPFVLLVPVSFWDFLISPEDYYQNPFLMTFVRWIRVLAYGIASLLPSIYVAATSFHQEMIPTTFALRIAAGREGTAFPAIVETILLEIQFEILREAGLRIPRKIGTAVSIVGVLVLGQALVAAGVVSPILIIVVGSTAVASFAVPIFSISAPARLLRFPLLLLAGTLGLYGLTMGVLLILAHLTALRSFNRPYLAPIAPLRWSELRDSLLFRAPWWAQIRRSRSVRNKGSG